MLKVKQKAIKAIEDMIRRNGKPVTFVKVTTNVDKYDPKKTTRNVSEVTVQALYHPIGRKDDNTVFTSVGVVEGDSLVVTVLLNDFETYELENAAFLKVENSLYKIKSYRKAIGFMIPSDRVYFFVEKAREQV